MSLTLGEKLRQAREEQGISISEVAENTRISPHYIKSIEEDNYKPLPGGIFNKGFIKSFARYLGVDENEALQDYADLIASQTEAPAEPPHAYRPEVLTDERYSESRAPTIIFAAVILAVMTLGLVLLVRFLQNRGEATTTANAVVSANTNSNTAGQPSPVDQGSAPAIPDKITIQLRAQGAPVWISYSVDDNHKIQTLGENETLTIEPNQSFSISYSKAKLDTLKVAVNGKDVAVPNDSPKGTVDFSINKSNIQEIMQSGQIKSSPAAATTPNPRPAAKATPKTSVSPMPSTKPKPPSANANRR